MVGIEVDGGVFYIYDMNYYNHKTVKKKPSRKGGNNFVSIYTKILVKATRSIHCLSKISV